jgi:hypothetical protein
MQKRNAVFRRRVEIGVECGTREGKRARSEAKVSPLNSHLAAQLPSRPSAQHPAFLFCILHLGSIGSKSPLPYLLQQ